MSSTDDSSSDSDDEMRLRLMETVVTVDQIKNEKQKEGKKKTNSRLLESQNRKINNHRLIRSGVLIDLEEKKVEKRKKPKRLKNGCLTDEDRERMIKETAVTFDQVKSMI